MTLGTYQTPVRHHQKILGSVLCVDDDPVVQLMLGDIVRIAGGDYHKADCARTAEDMLGQSRFDLILLDRKLPDSDGLLLLRTIKQSSDCPVIVLTSMNEDHDKILGLGLGAEEYVTKPFSPGELSSRVRSLLVQRLEKQRQTHLDPISLGRLFFQAGTRLLRVDTAEVYLPPAESRLLHAFLLEPGVPQSRDDLTRYVCGRDWTAGDRTVDVLVARLRRRIPPGTAKIVTIHRFGYVLNRID
ncbi:response regulator transcription factor [Roseibium album]|uniref:response regulator transcription factor n=1 Tax=Roseibium album TaxID=311410 RepID=UPI003BB1818B